MKCKNCSKYLETGKEYAENLCKTCLGSVELIDVAEAALALLNHACWEDDAINSNVSVGNAMKALDEVVTRSHVTDYKIHEGGAL